MLPTLTELAVMRAEGTGRRHQPTQHGLLMLPLALAEMNCCLQAVGGCWTKLCWHGCLEAMRAQRGTSMEATMPLCRPAQHMPSAKHAAAIATPLRSQSLLACCLKQSLVPHAAEVLPGKPAPSPLRPLPACEQQLLEGAESHWRDQQMQSLNSLRHEHVLSECCWWRHDAHSWCSRIHAAAACQQLLLLLLLCCLGRALHAAVHHHKPS